jgi:hypothetical protein
VQRLFCLGESNVLDQYLSECQSKEAYLDK